MMRVVADTNLVVSAFLWGGIPREILSAARR
jgi:predicted nucleic acid-binding protein